MVETSKKCVKNGENPNVPYSQCERRIKIYVFKQQRFPNTGTKKCGKWGELGENKGKVCPACPARQRILLVTRAISTGTHNLPMR